MGTWNPIFDEDLRTGIAHPTTTSPSRPTKLTCKRARDGSCSCGEAAHHLDIEAERAPIIDAGLQPWVEGVAAHFIRVNPTSVQRARARARRA